MPSKRATRKRRRLPETSHVKAAQTPATLRILEADAAPLELQGAAGEDGKPRAFTIRAYNGGKLRVAGFKHPVVVDLRGLKGHDKSRPIIRDHNLSREVGHTTKILVASGTIDLEGLISGDSDDARRVVNAADNGFPWKASIGARVEAVDFVPQGKSVRVNNQTFAGPVIVARQAALYEVSILTNGADDDTVVSIAATLSTGEDSMEFSQWLTANGFEEDKLGDAAVTTLRAMFDAEQSDDDDPPNIKAKGGNNTSGDVENYAELQAAESERIARIRAACAETDVTTVKIDGKEVLLEAHAIRTKMTPEQVELHIIRAERPKAPAGHVHAKEMTNDVIEAALCISSGFPELEKHFKEETLEAADRHFKNVGIQQVLIASAVQNGYVCGPGERIHRGNLKAVLRAALPDVQASANFSTLSLPGVFSNVANKELLVGYMEDDQSWREVAVVKSVRDFKQVTAYRMLDDMEYQELAPDGEIKHGKVGEESYTRQARTYARMFVLTREDIINDDMGAFDDIRTRLGRGASKKFNNLFWTRFLNNASFFTAARGNYIEGATTNLGLDGVGLEQGVTAFRMLRSPSADGSKRIGGRPTKLLVPPELEFTADRLYQSSNVNTGGASTATMVPNSNIHANKYRPVVVDWLSDAAFAGNSATAWYLFREVADMAAAAVSFLNGVQVPTVDSAEADFNVLGVQFRGYHDFGVDLAEYLAGIKSKGAA